MSFLDKIAACQRCDLTGFRRLTIGNESFGWITAHRADVLHSFPEVFTVSPTEVAITPHLTDVDARTAAVSAIAPALAATGAFAATTGEHYAVKNDWSDPEVMRLDRALGPAFGVRAYGVHLNGVVRTSEGLALWIATRADDRLVAPGKLDNVVAGGQPAGLSLIDNLVKECAEEAGFPADLARTARAVGAVTYRFTTGKGLRDDVLFCYDLHLPPNVTPRNTDGEIASFELMPAAEVLALVRDSDRFKFNVPLVLIDFGIRNGLIAPESEPDYLKIVAALRR